MSNVVGMELCGAVLLAAGAIWLWDSAHNVNPYVMSLATLMALLSMPAFLYFYWRETR